MPFRIHAREFPYCCTAKVLHGFGDAAAPMSGVDESDADAIRRQMDIHITRMKEENYGMMVVVLDDQQKTAYDILTKEYGFHASPFYRKLRHINTRICTLTRGIFQTYDEWKEEAEECNPWIDWDKPCYQKQKGEA